MLLKFMNETIAMISYLTFHINCKVIDQLTSYSMKVHCTSVKEVIIGLVVIYGVYIEYHMEANFGGGKFGKFVARLILVEEKIWQIFLS